LISKETATSGNYLTVGRKRVRREKDKFTTFTELQKIANEALPRPRKRRSKAISAALTNASTAAPKAARSGAHSWHYRKAESEERKNKKLSV
jgi:hypothetical protein